MTDADRPPSRLTVLLCRFTGQHDPIRERDAAGPFLRCQTCGWRSPGWRLEPGHLKFTRKPEAARG